MPVGELHDRGPSKPIAIAPILASLTGMSARHDLNVNVTGLQVLQHLDLGYWNGFRDLAHASAARKILRYKRVSLSVVDGALIRLSLSEAQ